MKGREFWIKKLPTISHPYMETEVTSSPTCAHDYQDFKDATRVIEHSSYQALLYQANRMAEALENIATCGNRNLGVEFCMSDSEIADQYSSVISGFSYACKQVLADWQKFKGSL